MKRISNLWNKITDFDILQKSFYKVKKKPSQVRKLYIYKMSLENNIFDLQERLNNGIWKPGPENTFIKIGPKIRLIRAPYFEDRIVHYSLVETITPIYEKLFIDDSFACRIGKGNINAMKELHNKIKKLHKTYNEFYYLKGDIRKFFDSMNHKILINIIKKKIKDPKVIDLCEKIIYNKENPVGLPIGFLTSQLFANIYLNELDYFIKRELKCKNYIRYMDDFVILDPSKEKLKEIYNKISEFLQEHLLLELNPKSGIDHIKNGIPFVGYKIFITHRILRRHNRENFRKNIKRYKRWYSKGIITVKQLTQRIASLLSYSKHCSSDTFKKYALCKVKFTKGDSK